MQGSIYVFPFMFHVQDQEVCIACTNYRTGSGIQEKKNTQFWSGEQPRRHDFSSIQGLKSQPRDLPFCIEASVESIRQPHGEPSSVTLSQGDNGHEKIEAFLPALSSLESKHALKGDASIQSDDTVL